MFLTFLGDVGGFEGALQLLFPMIAAYFSSQYFRANFVEAYFKQMKEKDSLAKVHIPAWQIVFEPLVSKFVKMCCCLSCCKGCGLRQRQRYLDHGTDRIEHELEIVNLLKRVRKSEQLLKELLDDPKHEQMMRQNKHFVLHPNTSESSDMSPLESKSESESSGSDKEAKAVDIRDKKKEELKDLKHNMTTIEEKLKSSVILTSCFSSEHKMRSLLNINEKTYDEIVKESLPDEVEMSQINLMRPGSSAGFSNNQTQSVDKL